MKRETLCAAPLALELVWEDDVIRTMHLHWAKAVTESPVLSSHGERLKKTLEQYVKGDSIQWPELPLDMSRLTPFSRKALAALATVPQGTFVTYGELAKMAGNPKGAQAIGRAMAKNPWPLIYPCHRVMGTDGSMTGFSASGGVELKEFLLRLEGALKVEERPAPSLPLLSWT